MRCFHVMETHSIYRRRLSLSIWLVILSCFYESPVANISRTTWVKPWMRWSSVRTLIICIRATARPRKSYPAGNYGSGKRGGGVSTVICAVLDDRNAGDADEDPKQAILSLLTMDVLSFLQDIAPLSALVPASATRSTSGYAADLGRSGRQKILLHSSIRQLDHEMIRGMSI